MRSRSIMGLALLSISATAALFAGGCGKARTELPIVVPLYGAGQPNVIADQYFVVMPDGTTEELWARTEQQVRDLGGQVLARYESVLVGFLANLSEQALEHLRRNPNISYIETDRTLQATGVQTCTTSWNLDRIDQGPLPLDGVYAYERTGKDVTVYVLDTGIDGSDAQISGRVLPGYNVLDKSTDALDRHGHGTHLAGIIGGSTLGVAKEANLFPVKVLDDAAGCDKPPSGSMSAVMDGINWILANELGKPGGKVLLLSCEEGGVIAPGQPLVTAINAAIKNNVVVVASAGNTSSDVSGKSFVCAELDEPLYAPYENRIVVGASTQSDQRWSAGDAGSNFGRCVDVYAPGGDVTSITSKEGCFVDATGRAILSGTSQAAAHVAGIAALMLEGTSADPGTIKKNIVSSAWSGALGDVGEGSKNLLAQNPLNKGATLPGGAAVKDADGVNDGLAPCVGSTCGLCSADASGNPCPSGLDCGGGLQCEQGACERCGANDEPCCNGQDCAPNLGCSATKGICTCGTLGEQCCADSQCNSGDLACNTATNRCETCGANQALCCPGGTCSGNDLVCTPGNTPDSRCELCGTQGKLCCSGGSCLTADLDCNPASGSCESCGQLDQLCCDGQCSGNLVCSGGACRECGVLGGPCCGNTCNGALDCVGGTCLDDCGSPNQKCCAGASPCDAGMDCASGVCSGFCAVRCGTGEFMYSQAPRLSAGDCATFGSFACMQYAGGSQSARIKYNGVLVGGNLDCGGLGEACCETTPICFQGSEANNTYTPPLLHGAAPNVAVHPSDQFCQ